MQAATAVLPEQQAYALSKIENEGKRNLAMSYYLRAGKDIAKRWSWTRAEIDAYARTPEFKQAESEIQNIALRFARENPSYVLHVNTQVRSLEEQLERWQTVQSIDTAADELRRAVAVELRRRDYGIAPDDKSLTQYLKFLISWRPSRPPTLAAPGLSLHGRGRAYDFQILSDDGRVVASVDSSTVQTVWDAEGWTEKLSRAVHGASDRFVGPLEIPREPWHYEYRP